MSDGDLTVEAIQSAEEGQSADITVTYTGDPPEPEPLEGTPFDVTHTLSVVGSWMTSGEQWTSADLTADIETFGECEVESASVELPRLESWEEGNTPTFWDSIIEPCFDQVHLGPEWLANDGTTWGEGLEEAQGEPLSFTAPTDEPLWVAVVDASNPEIDESEPTQVKMEAIFDWGGFAHSYGGGGYYGTAPPDVEIAAEATLRVEATPQETTPVQVHTEGEADDGGLPAWAFAAGAALMLLLAAGAVALGRRRRRAGGR